MRGKILTIAHSGAIILPANHVFDLAQKAPATDFNLHGSFFGYDHRLLIVNSAGSEQQHLIFFVYENLNLPGPVQCIQNPLVE